MRARPAVIGRAVGAAGGERRRGAVALRTSIRRLVADDGAARDRRPGPALAGAAVRERRGQRGRCELGRVLGAARLPVGEADRRERDVDDVELLGQRLDDGPVAVELVLDQRLAERVPELVQAPLADVGDRRQRDDLERGADRTLDVAQEAMFPRLDEGDRDALAPGPARPADAVDVDVGRRRDVVVHDVADLLDVEATGGDVGGDEDVEGAVAEAGHDPVALFLREAAVERRRVAAAAAERHGEVVHLAAGAREHQRRDAVLDVEDPAQRGELVRAADDVGDLAHARGVARGGARLDADRDRVPQVTPGEPGDRARDRGREQRRLVDLGQRAEDLLEVVGEAHVEHLVGLVEHDGLDLVEPDRPALEVIDGAPRRRDDDVDPAREPVELRRDRLAAVDGHDARPDLASVLVGRLGHLHRELARRRQDERLGPAPAVAVARRSPALDGTPGRAVRVEARREALEQRQGERRGLAGPGRRLGEQVVAREQRRDRGGLDRRRLLVPEPGQGLQESPIEAERRERRTRGRGRVPLGVSGRRAVIGRRGVGRLGRLDSPALGRVGTRILGLLGVVVGGHRQIVAPIRSRGMPVHHRRARNIPDTEWLLC